MRRPVMAGNWKMFKTAGETVTFFEKFRPLVEKTEHCEIVICPPFVNLPVAARAAEETRIDVGAQNLFWAKEGAYTGEVSGPMLKAAGARWVIVGHSERREYFGETDEIVLKKTVAALDAGLRPIVCVGERLEEREAGRTNAVLTKQCEGGIGGLTPAQFSQIVVAYEPVWAIGTGRTATPEIAAETHSVLRGHLKKCFGHEAAAKLRILYGGSVKPDNVKGLMAQPEIDGALAGGASLDPVSFASIVNF
ncbi:MAG: triose-phosphate isomerase [Pseudomonadota bacterium]